MSHRDLLESYVEKRVQKLKLSAIRITLGIVAGLSAAVIPGSCLTGLAVYSMMLLASSLYAEKRYSLLEGYEAYTTGLVSGLAAYVLGVFLASGLAS